MALTIYQTAVNLSTDMLQRGVVEIFARTSPVLELLPFMEIQGNSYQYNVELALPTVSYRDVGANYTPNLGTVERKFETLTIAGGNCDVDRYVADVLGNVNDQRAIQLEMKTTALSRQFTKDFFKGDVAVNPLQFNGIAKRLAGTAQELIPAAVVTAGGVLKLEYINELIDMVEGGPDALIMCKAMKRELLKILQASNHYIQNGTDEFGRPIEMYGGVQIRTVEDTVLNFDETQGTAVGTAGSIYAIKFGAQDAVAGLQRGGIQVFDFGLVSGTMQFRHAIEWFAGLAMFKPKAAARLKGIIKS